VRAAHRQDTIADILNAPDRTVLLDWLRQQHMAMRVGQVLMVHAGVLPQWTPEQTLALAGEVEEVLRGDALTTFMPQMYGGLPNQWHEDLQGADRLRVIVNALTRMRFCDAQGAMDFSVKESADQAPEGLMPWFEVPGRRSAHVTVAFGHWSTLKKVDQPHVVCLDDGCVWGGCLSALRIEQPEMIGDVRQLPVLSVKCQPALDPLA
jgi:bis(5'-nucleosyl)-tetraphosphatase (symmetrical)